MFDFLFLTIQHLRPCSPNKRKNKDNFLWQTFSWYVSIHDQIDINLSLISSRHLSNICEPISGKNWGFWGSIAFICPLGRSSSQWASFCSNKWMSTPFCFVWSVCPQNWDIFEIASWEHFLLRPVLFNQTNERAAYVYVNLPVDGYGSALVAWSNKVGRDGMKWLRTLSIRAVGSSMPHALKPWRGVTLQFTLYICSPHTHILRHTSVLRTYQGWPVVQSTHVWPTLPQSRPPFTRLRGDAPRLVGHLDICPTL